MEWQQLVGFYSVVELGSFTRAAEATFRTQSALSQQIKKLEDELDCKLFDRIGKQSISLTSAGVRFFKFAEEVLRQEKQFQEDLDEIKGITSGSISLAAPPGVLRFLLVEPFSEYQMLHPKVELNVLQRNPLECIDLVQSGSIDFGFAHGSTIPGSLKSISWKSVHYMAIAPKGHPLTKLPKIQITDLVHYPLILTSKDSKFTARSKLDEQVNEAGLRYRTFLESANVLLIGDFVSRGLGVSILLGYDAMKQLYEDDLDFIPMDHIFPPESISIVMRKDRWFPPVKEEFIHFVLSF